MRVTRTDFLGLDKMSYDELEEFASELADYNAELQETLQRRTKQFEGMAEMWVERGVENHKLREQLEACEHDTGAETCDVDETDTWERVRDDFGGYGKRITIHVMECTECGHTYEHVNGDYEYCPRCGRKRKDVDE